MTILKKRLLIIGITGLMAIVIISYLRNKTMSVPCHPGMVMEDEQRYEKFELSQALLHFPEMSLVSQDNESTTLNKILNEDRPLFLQFIFTTCPTICPVLSGHFSSFQEKVLSNHENVSMISISIDPDYDNPERLKSYADSFDAQSNWKFYTGDKVEIDKLQSTLKNYQGNKMYHRPATYYRSLSGHWFVYEGFISGDELWNDFHIQLLTTAL